MLNDRIEARWIDVFARALALCELPRGAALAILSESQSRSLNVHLCELAALQLGLQPFHIILPTPAQSAGVAIRSTGSSEALQGIRPVIDALKGAAMVADLTVEGLMHAPETPEILGAGGRILYISNGDIGCRHRSGDRHGRRAHRRQSGGGAGAIDACHLAGRHLFLLSGAGHGERAAGAG